MLDLKKIIDELGLDRDLIFTSISSTDKAIALRLVKRFSAMNIKQWCMYYENGTDRNISGDVYPETISSAISHSCIFVYLMSKRSLESEEVMKELRQIAGPVREGSAKVLPIFVDGTRNEEIPKEITELIGVDPHTIIRRFDANSTEEEVDLIFNEIMEQYTVTIFDKIKKKFEKQRNSQLFADLMNSCVKNKCTAGSICDDIKNSTEVATDSLKEMHVLSNELHEYDCNTYSCMIIASNLLGTEETVGGVRKFLPDKNGVKYFYYSPSDYEVECAEAFEIVKEFVRKSAKSRREVTALIRREFSARNKVPGFFKEFNKMTLSDFKEQYHIEEPEDIERFNKLFESEAVQGYFAYSDEDDVFSVPEEFLAWISGDNNNDSYDAMVECAYEFIDFIKLFVKFLTQAKDINNVSLERLKRRYTYLERFRELEDWQMGRLPDVSTSKTKRLVNYLLDYTADSSNKSVKKFPRLASWMQFLYNKDGAIVDIDDKTIEKAFNNLICVPIEESEDLQLCYSFAAFLERGELSAAWYTTGTGVVNDREEGTVTTYTFDKQDKEYEMLLAAWSYMLSLNPKAREVLTAHKSDLLRIIKENENKKKRGARK